MLNARTDLDRWGGTHADSAGSVPGGFRSGRGNIQNGELNPCGHHGHREKGRGGGLLSLDGWTVGQKMQNKLQQPLPRVYGGKKRPVTARDLFLRENRLLAEALAGSVA